MIIAIVVVLPAPLPPSSPVMLPRAIANETSSPARAVLYAFTRHATSIAGEPAGPRAGLDVAFCGLMRAAHWAIVVASARLCTCPGRGAAFFMPLRRAGTHVSAGTLCT